MCNRKQALIANHLQVECNAMVESPLTCQSNEQSYEFHMPFISIRNHKLHSPGCVRNSNYQLPFVDMQSDAHVLANCIPCSFFVFFFCFSPSTEVHFISILVHGNFGVNAIYSIEEFAQMENIKFARKHTHTHTCCVHAMRVL